MKLKTSIWSHGKKYPIIKLPIAVLDSPELEAIKDVFTGRIVLEFPSTKHPNSRFTMRGLAQRLTEGWQKGYETAPPRPAIEQFLLAQEDAIYEIVTGAAYRMIREKGFKNSKEYFQQAAENIYQLFADFIFEGLVEPPPSPRTIKRKAKARMPAPASAWYGEGDLIASMDRTYEQD